MGSERFFWRTNLNYGFEIQGSRSAANYADRRQDMKVTPLDLRQAKLKVVMRGYDRNEVDALLNEVADDYEQALRESDRLHQELLRLEAVVAEHREHERNLRNTLLTAQRLADEIREHAESDSRRIVEEAQTRADLVFQQTQGRLEEVQREIDGLKMRRRDVETTLQSTIATLRNALEFVREQDQKEREDKILLHRPRQLSTDLPPAAVVPQAKAVNESPTAAVMRALDAAAEGQP
jgi:cell division initiation protein